MLHNVHITKCKKQVAKAMDCSIIQWCITGSTDDTMHQTGHQ